MRTVINCSRIDREVGSNVKKRFFLAATALSLLLVACEDDKTTEVSNSAEQTQGEAVEKEAAITFTDDLGNVIEFDSVPTSIATLNPGIMDILLALGANVTGRPQISGDMTAEVENIQELGNPHDPSFEQIVATGAEALVVPPSFAQYAKTIEAAGTKIIYANMDSIEDIKETIEKYGVLFDNTAKADDIISEIDAKIAEASEASSLDALIIYGAPGTYLAALDNSLYGDILNKAGGKNIASDLPATDKYPSYANLSVEKIVERNPKVIMLITHSDPAAVQEGFERQMSENAAWKNLDAVKNGQIMILPADLFDNPGTQIVEALDYMRETLKTAEEAAK